jgi:multidrug efflux pump subunit AcrB
MSLLCSPERGGNTAASFNEVKRVMEQIEIPEGYSMCYFGEQESQDITMSALASKLPMAVLLMFITLLVLFPDSYRKSVLIMVMLPLMFIGVVLGLLICGKSLDFFATLGLLGLIGMNIKNAIVLVDEIGLQIKEGVAPLEAVIQSTKTRIVPVSMSSGTTILGMIPLLADSMFGGMAATIMGGLLASTLLTILVLPVCYTIFFKIKS